MRLYRHTRDACRRSAALAGLFFLLLGGCASAPPLSVADLAGQGASGGFIPVVFETGRFSLVGMLKGGRGASGALVVYIEGDGRAVRGGRPTLDPTPGRAQAYELALADPAPLVLYLGRIGQYHPGFSGKEHQVYWSDDRLGEAAVDAADKALDAARAMTGADWLHLGGYSGGGGMAALLAERRDDVLTLVTVAGLLDTEWWTVHGEYRELTGLNPADRAFRIRTLPQIHFYADRDAIIPRGVAESFQGKTRFTSLRRIEVPGDHWRFWTFLWPGLLREYVIPLRKAVGPPPAEPAPGAGRTLLSSGEGV